jgi:hypothetical protein
VAAAVAVLLHLQRIQFARTKSDAVAKLDGSYKPDKERSKKREAARGARGSLRQQQQQQHEQCKACCCAWTHLSADHLRVVAVTQAADQGTGF